MIHFLYEKWFVKFKFIIKLASIEHLSKLIEINLKRKNILYDEIHLILHGKEQPINFFLVF